MADDAAASKEGGLSAGAWGAITAITVAVVSGIVTLATHMMRPSPPAPTADPGGPPAVAAFPTNADAVAGTWAGTVAGDDGKPFQVEAVIARGCVPNARCGVISVSSTPCAGSLYLVTIDRDGYEFRVADFTRTSSKRCTPGAGEHLQPQADGTLLYTTSYEGHARGTLRRQ
jgi:hypothetical protein